MKNVLPGERDNIFGEVEIFSQIFLSFFVDKVVKPLPVEDKINHSSIFQWAQEHPDLDVWNIDGFVGLAAELLLDCNDSFLEEVSVHSFSVLFLNLNHIVVYGQILISNILLIFPYIFLTILRQTHLSSNHNFPRHQNRLKNDISAIVPWFLWKIAP